MNKEKTKILILVEGEKTDVRLMTHLLKIYGISQSHQIVSYNTNIYTLYNQMFRDNDPDSVDLLQLLKERASEWDKPIFDERCSDILLIFDLDPQDPEFSPEKIRQMAAYFVESSDMGKLYLNYPMVELFYHMKSIPDDEYTFYIATMDELKAKQYKKRVGQENRNHDYNKFAINRHECNIVIQQNIDKALAIIDKEFDHIESIFPSASQVLDAQLNKLQAESAVFVLCTCSFYIPEYNPKLLA